MRLTVLVALAGLAGCAGDPRIESVRRLGATTDREGPYLIEAVVVGAQPSDQVELRYAIDAPDAFVPRRMAEAPDEVFAAEIPGPGLPAAVFYFVAVVRDGEVVASAPTDGPDAPLRFDVVE